MKFIVGDFFKLTPKVAGMFEAAFDRGSLVCKERAHAHTCTYSARAPLCVRNYRGAFVAM